jgi:hypothetical protein
VSFDRERVGHGLEQFLGDLRGVVGRFEIGEEDGELVAAHAGDGVALAQDRAQPRRDRAQQLVAEAVAEGVVDVLEPVEIEEHHRQRRLGALGVGERDGQSIAEEQAIRQGRQRVVIRLILDLLLGLPALADVARDRDVLLHRAGLGIENGPARRLEPRQRAVLAPHPVHERARRFVDLAEVHRRAADDVVIFLHDDVEHRAAEDLRRLVAEQTARRVGGIDERAAAGRARDQVGRVLGHQPVAGLAVAQRRLGELAVGDVDDGAFEDAAVEHVHALEQPHRLPVLAAEADLHALRAALLADALEEAVALPRLEVEIARVQREELFLRVEAEDAGHGVVALDHPAVDAVAVDAGEVALEQQPVPLLGAAQRAIGAVALEGADEDLADDAQQGEGHARPARLERQRAAADRAEEPFFQHHRHEGGAADAEAVEKPALVHGLRRKVFGRRELDVLRGLQAVEPPRKGGRRKLGIDLLAQFDARRAPLVGQAAAEAVLGDQHDVAALGADELADRCERLFDSGVDLGRIEIDEARGNVRDQLLVLDAAAQRLLRLAAVDGIDGDGDQVGDGAGEGLILGRPEPLGPDVLEADHPGGLSEAADRGVEHGGDAERHEIRLAERAGARIEARVMRGDGALGLQSLEVDRIADGGELVARGVLLLRALVELRAADGAAVGRVEPDADALDVQRRRRALGDVAQGLVQIARLQGRTAGQIDQDRVLPPQTALRLAKKGLHARVDTVRAEKGWVRHGWACRELQLVKEW